MSVETMLDDAEFPQCQHLASCCTSQDIANITDIKRNYFHYYYHFLPPTFYVPFSLLLHFSYCFCCFTFVIVSYYLELL